MRHSHGLRASTSIVLPAIGASFQGGFFAGTISHTANSVATHALIVAPAATGATGTGGSSGTGYTLYESKLWKTTNTATALTDSTFNGAQNTAFMGGSLHPAAGFCQSLSIGGYTDWYLPAWYELEIAYYNLKPTTTSNNTAYGAPGTNPYSVPARSSNYTAGTPARTTVAAFQAGGAEAFVADYHWSSTQASSAGAWFMDFSNGFQYDLGKGNNMCVRAFRQLIL